MDLESKTTMFAGASHDSEENLKSETFTLAGLPHGCGSAIGAFIRSLYMTTSARPAIIGVSLNNLGFFEHLPGSTTLVSDIVCGIISEEYVVLDDVLTEEHIVGTSDLGTVWEIGVHLQDVQQLSTEHFSSVIRTKQRVLAEFVQPQDLFFTFYIMNVQGVMKEALSSACLQEVLGSRCRSIAPLSCTGLRQTNCWHTLKYNKFTEDVTIHLRGNSYNFADDCKYLQDILAQYMSAIIEKLQEL